MKDKWIVMWIISFFMGVLFSKITNFFLGILVMFISCLICAFIDTLEENNDKTK